MTDPGQAGDMSYILLFRNELPEPQGQSQVWALTSCLPAARMGSNPQEPPVSEESPLSCERGKRDPRMTSVISTEIISCILHQTKDTGWARGGGTSGESGGQEV